MDDLDAAFGFTEAADRAASAGACAAPPPRAGCSFWDELSTLQPISFTPSTPLPPTACPFNDRSRALQPRRRGARGVAVAQQTSICSNGSCLTMTTLSTAPHMSAVVAAMKSKGGKKRRKGKKGGKKKHAKKAKKAKKC